MLILIDDVLHSLAFPRMLRRRTDIRKPYKGTCRWLLHHPVYQAWSDRKNGLLWINGKPGSGKSVIMLFLNGSHNADDDSCRDSKVSFYFHGRGSELQHSASGMYRSILHQLYGRSSTARRILDSRCRLKKSTGQEEISWQEEELQCPLEETVQGIGDAGPLLIFIDALDEAGELPAREISAFWHQIMHSLVARDLPVKICMSSRDYPIIPAHGSYSITVEDHNNSDIRAYIRAELNAGEYAIDSLQRSLRNEAEELLCHRGAQGNFQWSRLVVPMISANLDDGQLCYRSALEAFISQVP